MDGREAVLDLHSSSEVGAAFGGLGLAPELEHEGLVWVNAETAASTGSSLDRRHSSHILAALP